MPDTVQTLISDAAPVLRIAALVLAGWVAFVWVCSLIYVVVTYIDSSHRLPRRPAPVTAWWMARELWLAMLTQPLMPFYQMLGGRMGGRDGRTPVVMVHGYFQNRVDFIYLAKRLRDAGCGPVYAVNFFWPQRLETSSMQVGRFVERVCESTGSPVVDLLTHSTGGLFALDLIAEKPGLVRRAVMLSIPAAGVPWKGPVIGRSGSQLRAGSLYQSQRSNVVVGTPVMSIYSAHDNLVHPVSTSQLRGEHVENVQVDGPGHLSILFDHEAADRAVAFLTA